MEINSSRSESTGHSPAYILYGREIRLPRKLFNETTPGSGVVKETIEARLQRIIESSKLPHWHMGKAGQYQARAYNLRKSDWRHKRRDVVWERQHPLSEAAIGFAAKLAPKYEDPFKVTGFVSTVIATIKHTATRMTHRADITN